jgi:hypothetical protein
VPEQVPLECAVCILYNFVEQHLGVVARGSRQTRLLLECALYSILSEQQLRSVAKFRASKIAS